MIILGIFAVITNAMTLMFNFKEFKKKTAGALDDTNDAKKCMLDD